MNEGLSHLTEDLVSGHITGGNREKIEIFMDASGRFELTAKTRVNVGTRAAAYLFVRGLVDEFGGDIVGRLVQTDLAGVPNVESAMEQDFEDLYRTFAARLFLRGTGLNEDSAYFYFVPCLIIPEQTQHIGQSAIGEIFDPHRMGDQTRQTLLMVFYPPSNFHHPIVAFRYDVRQPPCGQPAHTEALTIAVRLDHLIQDLGNAHFLLLRDKQRDIVYPFGINLGFWCYTRSMIQFCFLRNK